MSRKINKLRKILLFSLILTVLFGCADESKDSAQEESKGIQVISLGASNFGGVLLGEDKDAAINVINDSDKPLDIDLDFPPPFSINSVSQSCLSGVLPAGKNCIISVKFKPTVQGEYFLELQFGTKNVVFSGVGLKDGFIVIDDNQWDIGTVTAGENRSKIFTITNLGDLTIETPDFIIPEYMEVGLNECGNFMAAKKSCRVQLESQLTVAGDQTGELILDSPDGGTVSINFTALVNPNTPSGLIAFEEVPANMDSAGEEFVFITKPITDAFGNVVEPETNVSLSTNANLLSLDGNSFKTDTEGRISFRVRTRTIKGDGQISLVADQASGFLNFPITAGDAFGTIRIKPFIDNIPANGQTQTIITTEVIYDQYNNIIEDGTEVIFEVNGQASVSAGDNPKVRKTVAIGGSAFVRVTAGTLSETVNLKVYSGPIYNEREEIVGYKANGSADIKFVPGPAFGTFPISSGVNAIYSNNNPPPGIDIPTQTNVLIGPVKDEFGNIVAENTPISVNVSNGFNVSGVVPETESIVFTNEQGRASFILIGANRRGSIDINATVAGAEASHSVWGYEKSRVKYETVNNKVEFNFLHYRASENPDLNTRWATIKNPVAMGDLDALYYGYEKYSDRPATRFQINDKFPYFNWDCMFPAGELLIFNFCMQPNGEYSPMYKYNSSFDFVLDSPQVNNLEELILNGDFSPQNELDFWNDFEGSSQTSTGVKYSSDYTGTMWIDNRTFIDPEDPDRRKNFAVSSPFDVDPSKRYVLNFTIKSILGTTSNSYVELGYIPEDPNNLGQPGYSLPAPVIIQDDFDISTVGFQQRLVFLPPEGMTKMRLYFSTRGTGSNAEAKIDDVSFKELTTQNIHDTFSTDGVSVAFMPKWDQAIMFGGSAVVEESEDSYVAQTSGQTTVLSRILDTSVGIIINRYDEQSQTNIGEKPEARAHMSMTNSDDFIYTYGGLVLSGTGNAKDDFNVWNGETLKWSKLQISNDQNIPDPLEAGLGKPGKRYQNGLLYIPEVDNVYLFGGLRQDNDNEQLWFSMDDLWKIDMSQSSKEWSRICQTCNFVPDGIYSNLGEAWGELESNPSDISFQNYVLASRGVKRINSFWHTATQKAYFFIPETNFFTRFDPFTETFESLEIGGVSDMKNAYQITYNPETGRTFAYDRGEPGSENSKVFFWDMMRDEKQYIKVRFNLEEETKDFIQELKVNLYAYGNSSTLRPEGVIKNTGVQLYLFNYKSLTWDLVGENLADTSAEAQTPISFLVNDFTTRDYVSVDGKVDALVTPRGRPGFDGGDPKMGDSLELVKLRDASQQFAEIKEIFSGGQTTCAILMDETLKCWGRNDFGQLGQGLAVRSIGESAGEMATLNPIQVFNPQNIDYIGVTIKNVTIGANHSCALLSNGEVKCWGDNSDGKLGLGVPPVDSATAFGDGLNEMGDNLPKVNLFSNEEYEVIKIVSGLEHNCALIKVAEFGTRQRVKCWGKNTYGQLGTGDNVDRGALPEQMGDSLPWVQGILTFIDPGSGSREGTVKDISAGNYHTCAVVETSSNDDAIQCWGRNNNGQLAAINNSDGTANLSDRNIAGLTTIPTIEVYKLESGGDHNCISYFDGFFDKFNCWGKNDFGQLGRGGGGIAASQLVENGDFSQGAEGWDSFGSITADFSNERASVRGGGNGISQEFVYIKQDAEYDFQIDIEQLVTGASSNLIPGSLNWSAINGYGGGTGLVINLGRDTYKYTSRIRSQVISGLEGSRTYTYKFKITNAQGMPYFKVLDENFNLIYRSDKMWEGFHSFSFDLKDFQDKIYIEWYIDKYLTARIEQMEFFKNPLSSVPVIVDFYKNSGFGYELFDQVIANDTGTLRYTFSAPAKNIKIDIKSSANASASEEVFLDNVLLKLKDEIEVDLPLNIEFEFTGLDNVQPEISNPGLLNEVFVPKLEYPNFRAVYQKMLQFVSSEQNRIQLEHFPEHNIADQNFVIEMEIDPSGLGVKMPLLSKIGLSEITGLVNQTGGWNFYIDSNRRLAFSVDGLGVVAESQTINTGFQKIRVVRSDNLSTGTNQIRFYRDIGLGWKDITVGVLSTGQPIPDLTGINISNNTDAPLMIGSTFDDSTLPGEQRASGHYEGLLGYIYMEVGEDDIEFIRALLPDNNVLADFTDIGGGDLPKDFSLGDDHTCVVTQDDRVKCFGSNIGGQLGYGLGVDDYGASLENMGFNLPNVNLGSIDGTNDYIIKSISSGREFNCVVLDDDSSKCWGRNSFGQLGIDNAEGRGRGRDPVTGTNELKIDYIDLEGIF